MANVASPADARYARPVSAARRHRRGVPATAASRVWHTRADGTVKRGPSTLRRDACAQPVAVGRESSARTRSAVKVLPPAETASDTGALGAMVTASTRSARLAPSCGSARTAYTTALASVLPASVVEAVGEGVRPGRVALPKATRTAAVLAVERIATTRPVSGVVMAAA